MEASASLEVVPSIYVGLFASLGVTTGDGDASVSVGGQAEVYGMVSMNLKAQSNFKFQTAIGVTEPLPPLEPGYCNSTLLGCAASCLNDHDTELDANVALTMTAGYKLYASASFGAWAEVAIGSDELTPINVTHLDWVLHLGAWCYYLFPPGAEANSTSGIPSTTETDTPSTTETDTPSTAESQSISETTYVVLFEAGLKLGGDSGPPVLGVRGELVSDGVSSLELMTLEEWSPIDGLTLPKLNGTALFHPDGLVDIDATATLSSQMVIPHVLEFRDVYAYVEVAPFNPSSSFSMPDMYVTARGGLLVGGTDGFYVTIEGAFDTATRSGTLAVVHEGGWSPFPALSQYFATPRFEGTVWFNVDGIDLRLSASVQWNQSIVLYPGWVEFVGHPASSANGFELVVEMERATNDSAVLFTIEGMGGLKFGAGSGAPPVLGLRGVFESGGVSTLELRTLEEWHPLPVLGVPKLNGTITLFPDGSMTVDVTHEPLSNAPIIPNKLGWQEVQVVLRMDPFSPTAGAELPTFHVGASGTLLVGGGGDEGGGFYADFSGSLDTAAGSAQLEISHEGGWSPIPSLADYFTTPAFTGYARVQVGNVYLEVGGFVAFQEPIALIPSLIDIVGYGDNRRTQGPKFSVLVKKVTNVSAYSFSVDFQAGIRLGGGSSGIPIIDISGSVVKCGTSVLNLSTSKEWYPMQDALPSFKVPRLYGRIEFNDIGAIMANITHAPVDFGGDDSWYAWKGVQATVRVTAKPDPKPTRSGALPGGRAPAPPANCPPSPANQVGYPPSAPKYAMSLDLEGTLHFNMLGRTAGNDGDVKDNTLVLFLKGSLDTSTQVPSQLYLRSAFHRIHQSTTSS